jgi:serine-type D-Ala-D-Ala carboxypeptidase (penicillin-binding protein 5/6)
MQYMPLTVRKLPSPSRARAFTRAFSVLVATLLFAGTPATALASRLPADTVAGRTLASAPALKAVAPDMTAPAGILMDAKGDVLWERHAHDRRAMASTTKIMTAVVVLENAKLDDVVVVSKAAASVSESSAYLVAGEELTVRQLLEALLVHSANDAAFALAEHVGGTAPHFIEMMNAKAAALGLRDTHYMNPHGLDVKGHYTSAADLASLGRYAMTKSEFHRILKMRTVTISTPRGGKRILRATDDLMSTYEGLEGIKTGYTSDAGYCFVSAAKRGPVELFGAVLGTGSASSRFRQTARLLDWGFKHVRESAVATVGSVVGNVPVTDYLDKQVLAQVGAPARVLVFDLKGPVTRTYELDPFLTAPVAAGQVIGRVNVLQAGSVVTSAPVVAAAGAEAPGFWERASIFAVRSWRFAFGPRLTRSAQITARE